MDQTARRRVVIVGGGFAGRFAARVEDPRDEPPATRTRPAAAT